MGNVTDISEQRPHLTVQGKEAVHILPVSLIRDVAEGKKCITEIDYWEDFLPAILSDYLKGFDP